MLDVSVEGGVPQELLDSDKQWQESISHIFVSHLHIEVLGGACLPFLELFQSCLA